MDYFDPIEKQTQVPAHGKDYIRQLNSVRSSLKHQGLRPDPKQWAYVAEKVFGTVEKWCSDYLQVPFAELDESELLRSVEVKRLFKEAQDLSLATKYKESLEKLGLALAMVLNENGALQGIIAGEPSSEDAIRLSGFAVHANDFLALQEFLPRVARFGPDAGTTKWKQSGFGHPGNWTLEAADFCLRTFLDVAIKIQDAAWRPRAIQRMFLYDQQVEVLRDGVEIWKNEPRTSPGRLSVLIRPGEVQRRVVVTLKRGEKLKGMISLMKNDPFSHFGRTAVTPETLEIWTTEGHYGLLLQRDVRVTCIPIENETITEFFPKLPVLDWEPE
jgi:hypothetical protein